MTPPVDTKVSNLSRWTGIPVTELQAKSPEELEKVAPLVLNIVADGGPISIGIGATDLDGFKPTSTTAYVDGKAIELKQGTSGNLLLELPDTAKGTELELTIPAGYYATANQHKGFKAKTLRLMSRAMLQSVIDDFGDGNTIYRTITEVAEDTFAYIEKRPIAPNLFDTTFMNCTSLTAIPAGLFSGVSGSAPKLFNATFMNCSSLTGATPTIGDKKLWEVAGTSVEVGGNCFYGCTGLSDYAEIPAQWK